MNTGVPHPPTSHVLVLHRWRDRHAHYARYLDHSAHRVSYVTTASGRESVPTTAAAVSVISATDAVNEVRAAVAALVRRLGPVTRLVALNEGDLDTAAVLRAELDLPGQRPGELRRFRDKLTMVTLAAEAGIRVPPHADAADPRVVADFARRYGWPVVLKPRRGTASRGVRVLHAPRDVPDTAVFDAEPLIVQSYVTDPVVHVDGLWTGRRLGPWRASRYVNSCRGFTQGEFLGSVEIDDPELLGHLEAFTGRCVSALGGDRPRVFHLEAFVGKDADGTPRITFLEAGARVGGGEIPFVWREVHGTDLMGAAAAIQLGRDPEPASSPAGETAGWLLLPVPVPPPCRVVSVRVDVQEVDGPYARVIPTPGSVIPRIGGYEHVAARFRFRGPSSQEVEAAVMKTASSFTMRCAPLPA
ncbi:biotin carboxylase [Streptomyces alkaliphilus]|uniref:Biotin carboxylase n=1 Tax=Streptomyces alkaliphilus TaxID=1472722 RepID=A0A7W3T9W9_9ACTN|nr:biotin carboxylase [Streptomyces alkaliphilus]MBB0242939.1 biotin carboxylase [Streptomyces alkaliphilus]